MKCIKIAIVALFAFAMSTQAQEQAIGIRFGSGNVKGAELSYQMPMGGETNRLQLDLGVGFDGDDLVDYFSTGLTGTYQWVFALADVDGLAWYAGAGATLGFWSYETSVIGYEYSDSGLGLGVGGIVGIEYTLDGAPVQFSLDTRPMFNLVGSDDYNGSWGAAFAVRYVL